ncbi:hypothetical protein BPNPMPFG_000737 [Mesorhizobium sp. AR07]|nr:hypothetical protein BPNPMPFG_000737 [Mesorhizobium sp. AR07]
MTLREEMLVAMNGQRALIGKARADAVGALGVLAPDSARPQAPLVERIGDGAGAFDRNAVAIGVRSPYPPEANVAPTQKQRNIR